MQKLPDPTDLDIRLALLRFDGMQCQRRNGAQLHAAICWHIRGVLLYLSLSMPASLTYLDFLLLNSRFCWGACPPGTFGATAANAAANSALRSGESGAPCALRLLPELTGAGPAEAASAPSWLMGLARFRSFLGSDPYRVAAAATARAATPLLTPLGALSCGCSTHVEDLQMQLGCTRPEGQAGSLNGCLLGPKAFVVFLVSHSRYVSLPCWTLQHAGGCGTIHVQGRYERGGSCMPATSTSNVALQQCN